VSCSIKIKQSAAKSLARINRPERERIIQRIDQLAENPGAGSVLKGELSGLRRIRIGTYRVVYELRDAELIVLVVRNVQRGETYVITEHRRPVAEVRRNGSDTQLVDYPSNPFSFDGIDPEAGVAQQPGLAMALITEDRGE